MNTAVESKFASYPRDVQPVMLSLRELILEVAKAQKITSLEETLKWNEPAYLAKGGSTLRIDWKPQSPQQIFMYFNCQTTLIETIKEVYFDTFIFSGNRAICLDVAKPLPIGELRECIALALRYHKIKHLPLLGL